MPRPITAIALLTLGGCVPAFAAGHDSVPPASFLQYHVGSVPELTQEVSISPIVRTRLARHFHVSEAAMTGYVRRNLVLSHLKTSGDYQVACVRPNGREYWATSHLPEGTLIFASRATGQPILKLACGNPMVKALPKDPVANLAAPQVSQTGAASVQDAALVSPALMTETPTVDTVLVADALPAGVVDVEAPEVKTAGSFQFARFGGSPLSAIFPALAGVAIAVASSGGGHNGGFTPLPGVPGTPSPPNHPPVPAVPEASSSISLGVMLAGGALWLLRRKRQSA